jgi:2-polyprenyl-6-methoxyphenol hydroxylase-like FAD-dependent oxidoreductase
MECPFAAADGLKMGQNGGVRRSIMSTKTILISGVGIAGPTLAYWLKRAGFVPTLLEHAPALRTGGYVVDFWGLGFDIAERMGLVPKILNAGYRIREMRIVDAAGRRISGFGTDVFVELTGPLRDYQPPRTVAAAFRDA